MSCLSLLQEDRFIRICLRQADVARPKIHEKFSSCDTSVNLLKVHCRKLETEKTACQSVVRFHEAQIHHLRRMSDVERQKIENSTGRYSSLWTWTFSDLSKFGSG